MPPKQKITKEMILRSSINLINSCGANKLTARNLAEEIGCSTQPIYSVFSNFQKLEEETADRAESIMLKHMLSYKDENSPFLGLGMGYFEFACQNPELFRFLYMTGKRKLILSVNGKWFNTMIDHMMGDAVIKTLPAESHKELLKDMSIYTHGLCTAMISNNVTEQEKLTFRKLLRETGFKLTIYHLYKFRGTIDEDKMKEECRKIKGIPDKTNQG